MQRKNFFITIGIFLLLSGTTIYFFNSFPVFKKALCPDCNIILISVDSVTYDHLGLYGYQRNVSPNLDKWSDKAIVFDQYITASNLTPITQMSLQTGRYPSNNGVVSFSSDLRNDVPTLAEMLKKAGYTTAAIGSAPEYYVENVFGWQTRRDNFRRGFDQYFDDYFKNQNIPQSLSVPDTLPENHIWPQKERGLPVGALNWLSQQTKQKFFLWIPIGTVHWPYNIEDEKPFHFTKKDYRGLFQNDTLRWQLPSEFKRVYRNKLWRNGAPPISLSPDDVQFVIDRYDDGIYLTDQFLGEVFKTIENKDLLKNTIVIITAEHGEEFGEHGYMAHYDIFDPEIHTPLIINIPGIQKRRVKEQVATVDILPTVLDALGIQTNTEIDGKSFLTYLKKNGLPENFRPYAFIERTPLMESLMIDSSDTKDELLGDFLMADGTNHFRDVGIRTDKWKLIYRESRQIQEKYSWWRRLSGDKTPIPEFELYNLNDKPLEHKNVISEYPEIAGKLKQELFNRINATDKRRKQIPQDNEEIKMGAYLKE